MVSVVHRSLLSLVPLFVTLWCAYGVEDSINVLVKPQARECFYEDVTTPQKLNVEVFVQSGGKSDVLLEVLDAQYVIFLAEIFRSLVL